MVRDLQVARRFGLGAWVAVMAIFATVDNCPAQTGTLTVTQEVNGVAGIIYGGGDFLTLDVRATVSVPAGHPGPVTFFLSAYLEDDDSPPTQEFNWTPYAIVSPGDTIVFGEGDGFKVVPFVNWYYGESKVWHVVAFAPVQLDFQDYYFQRN